MHLFGQPGDAPALPIEFGLDAVADVKVLHARRRSLFGIHRDYTKSSALYIIERARAGF
jgi:hypothetical protein